MTKQAQFTRLASRLEIPGALEVLVLIGRKWVGARGPGAGKHIN